MISSNDDEKEIRRIEALYKLRVLDTAPESSFDEIVKLASLICETPISLVSLVDMNRQWFKAKVGFNESETPRDIAFCNHVIKQNDLMIVSDASIDSRFYDNPMVTGATNLRFYAGMPITTADGFNVGALCVIDSIPRQLNEKQIVALKLLANQVMDKLELRLITEKIETQRISLLERNRELHLLNEDLTSSTEEIQSNLDQIEKLQRYLEIKEDQYRGLVENATDLIYELDEHGLFTFVNPVFERATEYSREELLKTMYLDLVHPSHHSLVIDFYRNQRKSKAENSYLEFIIRTKSGKMVWVGQNVHMFYSENGHVYKVSAISRNITALKETEQKLAKSEKRFRLLSDNSPIGIFQTDINGKCTYVNRKWCMITGISPGDALGDGWMKALMPPERQNFVSQWKESLTEIGEFVKEMRFINKDGEVRWVTTRVNQLTGENGMIEGYIVTTDDITELKETHHKLSEREKLYRLLSTNSKDLITLCKADEKATRIFVSPSVREILGYEPEELVGESLFDQIEGDDVERVRQITTDTTLIGKAATIEYRTRRKDGSVIWLESNSHPYFDTLGNMAGFQSSARDITKRKEFEKSLQESKQKAEEATMAKSKFLSMMSHEIRTPMNAIIGLTNLLLEESLSSEQKESLEILKFSGQNLLKIINDILDFSKIESDKIELECVDFDLYKSIQSVKSLLGQRTREKNIDLIINYDNGLPQFVKGDSVRLVQVITNLMGNAIKFTEKGHVELSVTRAGFEHGKHKIKFAVKDTGIGIEADKIQSIFERFAQADNDTTRKYGGTGLGLSITKSLLSLMGSDVHVESHPGKGSTFTFEVLMEAGLIPVPRTTEKFENDDFRDNSTTVLLVEDNRINQIVATKFLVSWGIRVDTANNGKEGLEMIRKKTYDLVLMDVQMPVMDGYEAVLGIRALEGTYFKEVPIIALTASAMLGMRDKVIAVGMNDFITKPFVPSELHAAIKKFVFHKNSTTDLISGKSGEEGRKSA
jgi:PAS domain S-box-containing protein